MGTEGEEWGKRAKEVKQGGSQQEVKRNGQRRAGKRRDTLYNQRYIRVNSGSVFVIRLSGGKGRTKWKITIKRRKRSRRAGNVKASEWF